MIFQISEIRFSCKKLKDHIWTYERIKDKIILNLEPLKLEIPNLNLSDQCQIVKIEHKKAMDFDWKLDQVHIQFKDEASAINGINTLDLILETKQLP